MNIIYPADMINHKVIDEVYKDESIAMAHKGLSSYLLRDDGSINQDIVSGEVLYRGWMMSLDEYTGMIKILKQKDLTPITTTDEYEAIHHLPNWLPTLEGLTPETFVFSETDDLVSELKNIGWDRYFIKDFVKSLKTTESRAIINRAEDITKLLEEMRMYRGEIEGGVCVRRVEDYIPESEVRFFVLDGAPYAPKPDHDIPTIVRECIERLNGCSRFYSVDCIKTTGGDNRIVEVGDGQVSGLVGWTPDRF